METRLIIMDILTFVCIPIYAEENRRDEYLDKLQVQSGNISTTIFNFQEKFWEHSYVMKSLFGYTENKGISASYQFTDWVSADAIFMPIEDDDKINYRMGVSFTPTEGLHIRLYGGVNDNNEINQFTSANMAAFIGYKSNEFTLGAELNHTINSPYILNNNVVGYSIFASVKLANCASFYTRYDEHFSVENSSYLENEQAAVVGFEFMITDKIKLSPNFKLDFSKNSELSNSYFTCLSCNIKF